MEEVVNNGECTPVSMNLAAKMLNKFGLLGGFSCLILFKSKFLNKRLLNSEKRTTSIETFGFIAGKSIVKSIVLLREI